VLLADQRETAGAPEGGDLKPNWRWFLGGVGVALAVLLLALIFAAYQMPELLLDLANLRYCG